LLRRVTEQRRLVEEPEEQRLAHERGKLARQRELVWVPQFHFPASFPFLP